MDELCLHKAKIKITLRISKKYVSVSNFSSSLLFFGSNPNHHVYIKLRLGVMLLSYSAEYSGNVRLLYSLLQLKTSQSYSHLWSVRVCCQISCKITPTFLVNLTQFIVPSMHSYLWNLN